MQSAQFDPEAFGKAVGEQIRDTVAPLLKRIDALEATGIKFCGTHQRAMEYARGSVVVHNGSSWVAVKDMPDGPPGDTADWALMARAGRDGKDAR